MNLSKRISLSLGIDILKQGTQILGSAEKNIEDVLLTTRFFKSKLEFVSRPSDIFIASYPRSGQTWMQFILYLMTSDQSLDFRHISEVSPWWERSFAHGIKGGKDFDSLPSPRIFKSHLPKFWLPQNVRFICIERDGYDVLRSYYHLYKSHLNFQGEFDEFFELFLQGKLQYRSWFKFTHAWRKYKNDPNVLYLHYEELIRDFPSVISKLERFLSIQLTTKHKDNLTAMSSFQFMKTIEEKFDPIYEFATSKKSLSGQFIRKGRSGDGKLHLTAKQRFQFEAQRAKSRPVSQLEFRIADFLH